MEATSLDLEPDWNFLEADDTINFLAELVIWDPSHSKHLVKSCLYGRYIVVEGHLPKAAAYTFLDAVVVRGGSAIKMRIDKTTYVMHHVIPDSDSFINIVETFSGLGIMSSGLIESGCSIKAKNELRSVFIQHQSKWGNRQLVEGDLGTNEVIQVVEGSPQISISDSRFQLPALVEIGGWQRNEGRTSHGTPLSVEGGFFPSFIRNFDGVCHRGWKGSSGSCIDSTVV